MREILERKLARFEQLERMMSDPEVLADPARLAAVAREHGALAKLARRFRAYKQLNAEMLQLREMLHSSDPEERELAEAELESLRTRREQLWEELLDMTVGGQDATRTRCVMEIRAGTGGEEAGLFARDLYEMYRRHAESKGWKVELIEAHPTELGGFKSIILGLEGEGVYRELRYESGGHRVQRVPETEAKGRTHTSLVTVAVLPEPEDVEVELKPDDYVKETFRASGPGGQHVNKTDSAIRLTHKQTGIVVSMQDEKSQHKNLAKALRVLKTRLYELYAREEEEKRASQRKSLVGSGDRSQKVRTYNFPENRITDHRVGYTVYRLEQTLQGDLQHVTNALVERDRSQLRDSLNGDGDE